MNIRLWIGIMVLTLAGLITGCSSNNGATGDTANVNANLQAATTTRTGPDNSEITTTTDANGVKTETRVFRDNGRVSRVVVTTTRDGRRTVRVVSRSGEEKEIDDVGDALEATGDKIADAAGFVGDKAEDVASETGDKAEDVGDKTKNIGEKTAEGAKAVGEKTGEGAKAVGEKTAAGAKTVGKKTAEGAKKAGKAIKKVVTP